MMDRIKFKMDNRKFKLDKREFKLDTPHSIICAREHAL